MSVTLLVLRALLAAVFAAAGLAKLADQAGARRALRDFGVPAGLVPAAAVALPVAELAAAAALLLPATAWWAAVAAVALLAAFTAVIAVNLARGRTPECNCFGSLSAGPVGRRTLVRNGVFVALAGVLVAAGPARTTASGYGGLEALSPPHRAGLAAAVLGFALLAVEGWLLVGLMRQNGRLLDRIVLVEQALHGVGHRYQLPLLPTDAPNGAHGAVHHRHGAGPSVGDPAPSVGLTDLDGNRVELAQLWSPGPIAVLFWSPHCGFCNDMLPDLRAADAARAADAPRLLLLSSGSAEDNRALGLASPVLLDHGFAAGRAFGANGTPQAVLVDAEGTIASPLAAGAQAVLRLMDTRMSVA